MYGLTTEYDKQLSIALDYDETFTANRELWTGFIALAKRMNCKVTFVTHRMQTGHNMDIIYDSQSLSISTIFSNGEPKSSVFVADIWIDDSPITIPSHDAMNEIHRKNV
jgi:hypothetical protein